jgi:hypothetical protein
MKLKILYNTVLKTNTGNKIEYIKMKVNYVKGTRQITFVTSGKERLV